jgi:hypothetical protein
MAVPPIEGARAGRGSCATMVGEQAAEKTSVANSSREAGSDRAGPTRWPGASEGEADMQPRPHRAPKVPGAAPDSTFSPSGRGPRARRAPGGAIA